MAQEDSRQEGRRAERWARVNFPNKFVHPHEYTARDGRVFDKMFVSIPPGVTLNGVDLGGYAFDHFAKPREIEQKANGRPVAINFRPGEPVRLFRGVGPERRTLEISNPWDLCRAVKAHNDEYARSRQEAAAMSAEASQARGAAGGGGRVRHVRRAGRRPGRLPAGRPGRPDHDARPVLRHGRHAVRRDAMSDYIDDRIEGNFVFLAVRATDGSGRRAGVDLPMDPDELARFEGEQGLMAPSDYRIDGYSKDGIVGRMGFAPFRDDSPLEDVNLLCRAVDAASRSDPHAADKVAAWAECWEVDDPRVLAGVAVRSADIPIHRYSRPRGMDDLQWRGLDPLGRLGASMSEERGLYGALRSGGVADSFDYAGYAYAAREDDDRQMWCSDDGYIVDADLPNMPPLSARGLEDAVAALETGATVMDPADPTNMAVTAAESGRAL